MYESPIKIIESTIGSFGKAIIKQKDDAIFAEIQSSFGVDVDKGELIRALQYDRQQYEKGYADGKRDAMDDLVRCKDCERGKKSADLTKSVWCMWYGTDMPKDGFCSYGKRREGE